MFAVAFMLALLFSACVSTVYFGKVHAAAMWNQTYGGPDDDYGYSVVETSDGGYAIAGETLSFGAGSSDVWLVKINATGHMEWNQTYGGPSLDTVLSVLETSDGGYMVAGYTVSFGAGGADVWLVKTNATGTVQWNQTYGGLGDDYGRSVAQTSDGGYMVASFTDSFGAGGYDFWLVRTDAAGMVQWNQTYGGTGDDVVRSVIKTSDEGYAIAGVTDSYGAGSSDVWLVKIDAAGMMQWNQTYGGPSGDEGSFVVETVDGGYAIVGFTWSYGAGLADTWLIKTDEFGVVPEAAWIILPLLVIATFSVFISKKKLLRQFQ